MKKLFAKGIAIDFLSLLSIEQKFNIIFNGKNVGSISSKVRGKNTGLLALCPCPLQEANDPMYVSLLQV